MDTLGDIADKLSIMNIRTWFFIDKQKDETLSEKERLDAAMKVMDCNSQRNYLIDEFNRELDKAIKNREVKSFRKNKLYKGDKNG